MDGDYRIGDAERERAIERLQAHCAAGRLSLDEMLDRGDAVRAALTRSDLASVLSDLPDDEARQRRGGWRDRGWRTHAALATVTTGGVVGLWQLTRDTSPAPQDYGADYWWPLWLALFWGVAVGLHYLHAAGRLNLLSALPQRAPAAPPPLPVPPHEPEPAPDAVARLDALTDREREVMILIGEGCANKEIARRLYISERTARTHVSNILRKLDLPSRTQAALVAVRAGLASPPPDQRGRA